VRAADATSTSAASPPRTLTITSISDSDGDGVIDSEDNCPVDANPDQRNSDDDQLGDACDADDDNDGVPDDSDACRLIAPVSGKDADGDGCPDTRERLATIIEALPINTGQRQSLLAKLQGKLTPFANHVEAQRGKALTDEQADLLIDYASNVLPP
jgi:hypothetical protein